MLPKSVKMLVVIMIINVTGAFILMPLHTIYMHNILGKSLTFTGFILMLNQGLLVLGNLLGGILFDKFSPYRIVLYGVTLTLTIGIALIFLHTNVIWYSVLLILMGFSTGIVWPVIFASAGAIWIDGGRRPFNAIFVALNFGVAVGAVIGGYLASISFYYLFIANASLFGLSLISILMNFREVDKERESIAEATANIPVANTPIIDETKKKQKGKPFYALLILGLGFLIIKIAYSQWMTTIASHIQDIGIPLEQYSSLWAINGFLIVLGQPLISLFVKKVPSNKLQIHVGNIILMGAFLIVIFAEEFTMFVVAMVILTAGEMLVSPAFPTMANELAPRGKAGIYQGFITSASSGGNMVGPLLGGILIDLYNIKTFILILLFLMLITYLTTQIYDHGSGKTKTTKRKKSTF